MPLLCSYIFDEYKAQHRQEEPSPALGERGMWRRRYCQRCPQQTNGWDCGVFTIMAAEYLGLGKPWDYGQQHMKHIRVKMVNAIKCGKLSLPE
jgi:Ulp1 family protease